MLFFLPEAADAKEAEQSYEAIRKFVEMQMGPLDGRRYFRIDYRHNAKQVFAEVGKDDPLERQLVVAIFRSANSSGPFYVCTPMRGVIRGGPILASGDARAIEFQSAPDQTVH